MQRLRSLAPDPDQAVAILAASQHGVISRRQALALGMTRHAIDRRIHSGRWRVLHPGIYVVAGTPPSRLQTLMGACLWGGEGTAGSHRTAASILLFDDPEPDILEITSPRRLSSSRVMVHRAPPLTRDDIVVVDGIPLTNATLTILGLASVTDEDALEVALDTALRKCMTSIARLRWQLSRGTRGHKGAATLRALVEARRAGTAPVESPLEAKLARLLGRYGLPTPVRQFHVRDDHARFLGRVDLAYPDARLAIEADSYRWHSGRHAWQRDLRRRNALVAAGWQVLHITSDDVKLRPEDTVDKVRAALGTSGTEASETEA